MSWRRGWREEPQPGMAGGPQPGMAGSPAGPRVVRVRAFQPQHGGNSRGHRCGRGLPRGRGGGAPGSHQDGGGDPRPWPAPGKIEPSGYESGRVTGHVPGMPLQVDVLLSEVRAAMRAEQLAHLAAPAGRRPRGSPALLRLNLPAGTIIYLLSAVQAALASGVGELLSDDGFKKNREYASTGLHRLARRMPKPHDRTPSMTGRRDTAAPATPRSSSPATSRRTSWWCRGELLSYWKQLTWIKD